MNSLKKQLKCELAKREFYEYCKTMHPNFYKKERAYLKELCDKMQDFYYNDDEFMIINAPPRHAKSFSCQNFVEWILGQNPVEKIISASYGHDLSKTFSKKCRNAIEEVGLDDRIVYSDVFPNTRIKFGSAEATKWQTDASSQINYLATSPTGSATGFGCTFMVVDDLIKNAYEANNETTLEGHWQWFTNTMLSRREGKKKVLIVMTRWSSKDLAGRIIEYCEEENLSYSHINFKAELGNGKMLCEDIFSAKDADKAKKLMGEDIYSANYNQEPIDLKGSLYSNLLTYEELPRDKIITIDNYTDTADKGQDYLCSIDYAVDRQGYCYVLDVIYTQEAMETTEEKVAAMITKDFVNFAHIESNNGGRGFARNVKDKCLKKGNRHTTIKPFHQSKNKESRILTGSTGVMQNILFPSKWKQLYPEFYKAMISYQRIGKNAHDDAQDTITGVYEKSEKYRKGIRR